MGEASSRLKNDLTEFIADENATTTLEYVLMLALVVVVVISAYQRFGISTRDLVQDSTRQMSQAGDGAETLP